MDNKVFGTVSFKNGWNTEYEVKWVDTAYKIRIVAAAYYEKDGITQEQEVAFGRFKAASDRFLGDAKRLISASLYAGRNDVAQDRLFAPRTLLIQRNGEIALLLDEQENPDRGLAVVLEPKEHVETQDDYL